MVAHGQPGLVVPAAIQRRAVPRHVPLREMLEESQRAVTRSAVQRKDWARVFMLRPRAQLQTDAGTCGSNPGEAEYLDAPNLDGQWNGPHTRPSAAQACPFAAFGVAFLWTT